MKNNLVPTQLRRAGKLGRRLCSLLAMLLKRSMSVFITGMVVFVTVAYIVYATVGLPIVSWRLPFTSSNPNTSGITTKLVSTSTKSASIPEQRQENPVFSDCPSFFVDYTNQQNGPADTNDFNIFNGAPIANQEAEYYTNNDGNIRVENGSLLLQALHQSDHGYNFTSARIDTHGKRTFCTVSSS